MSSTWKPAIVSDPANKEAALEAVAGDKYTYRDLDNFTDTIQRSLKTLPIVSKVERSGVLNENGFLNFSQERLAQYRLTFRKSSWGATLPTAVKS